MFVLIMSGTRFSVHGECQFRRVQHLAYRVLAINRRRSNQDLTDRRVATGRRPCWPESSVSRPTLMEERIGSGLRVNRLNCARLPGILFSTGFHSYGVMAGFDCLPAFGDCRRDKDARVPGIFVLFRHLRLPSL